MDPNFFGHAFNTATYVIKDPEFGWQSFGGNIITTGEWVNVQPLDSFRKRVYVARLRLWLTLDAGTFESIAVNTRSNIVPVTLSRADRFTRKARLQISGAYAPREILLPSAMRLRLDSDARQLRSISPQKGTKTQKIKFRVQALACSPEARDRSLKAEL